MFVPLGAPDEGCALVDFPDVGLGQQLGEKLHGIGVDQLRLTLGMAGTVACGLSLFVAERVPELLAHVPVAVMPRGRAEDESGGSSPLCRSNIDRRPAEGAV